MACYRRLISDVFRRYSRKTSPMKKCVSRSCFSSQPIFMKSDLQRKGPFIAKRSYSTDFSKEVLGWYKNPRNLVALGFVGGLVVIPVYCWNSEKVPYTNRGNFVLLSTYLETKMAEFQLKLFNKGEILASHHPECIRVEKIGQDIIGALWKKLGDDEKTAHLKEFKWQFIVVNEPTNVNSWSFSGGKIVVSTGLLSYLKTDEEIAIVIGREVGHAVARHNAETMSAILWLAPSHFLMSHQFRRLPRVYQKLHQVTEADYIGLLMSASAGYDPRIAPSVYMKLKVQSRPLLEVPATINIDLKNRAERLSEPKIMDEAFSIYREALNDNDKDPDFLKEKKMEKEGHLNFF